MAHFSERIKALSEQLETVKDEKKTCEKKSEGTVLSFNYCCWEHIEKQLY